MVSKGDMLEIADHLERMADDAYMEHDDVVMTPREVHALAADIKSFALEHGRETCRLDLTDVETHGTVKLRIYECSRCGRTCEEAYGKYERCPHCGAMVFEKEDER